MTVRIAHVLPDLLGTYGDRGNVIVLTQRLRWRGIGVEVVDVNVGDAVPAQCDIYVVGGGEDTVQDAAVTQLARHPGLQRAASSGAVVFAVCAGLQLLGTSYTASDGVRHDGLGLLDITTSPLPRRAIGELVGQPVASIGEQPLTGFENHRGGTMLGADAGPLATVTSGVGNGVDRVEGVVAGRVVGTYLHGPALARNPELADRLLTWATGRQLPPLALPEVTRLREDRLGGQLLPRLVRPSRRLSRAA